MGYVPLVDLDIQTDDGKRYWLGAATARFEEAERALKEALLRVGVLRRKRTLKLREIGRL